MTEKTNSYIRALSKSPNCNKDEYYRWADFIELKCLANKDLSYSKAEFIDHVRPRVEDLGEGDDEIADDKHLSKAQKNDKWERRADDIYRLIKSRIAQYDTFYPFEIDSKGQELTRKLNLSTQNEYYLFLLFSSNLAYTSSFKTELTGTFENMSLEVLKAIHPEEHFEFSIFGSSNTENNFVPWNSTKIFDKLKWLSAYLSLDLTVNEENFNPYNKGDGGLDIVGKLNSKDGLKYFSIFFAQCACSPEDWVEKQSSTSRDTWDSYLNFHADPSRFMFIPQSFRGSNGEWHDILKIKKNVLFDRLRILKYFNNEAVFKKYRSYPVLNELIKAKESVF